jgi:hypothetical protein
VNEKTSLYMYKKILLFFFIILFLIPIVRGGEFMGLFKKDKEIVYPFSGFEGQLLFKGEPAAGAKIIRSYELQGADKVEETINSDSNGLFKFESIAVEHKKPTLAPLNFLSHQDIFVEYKNQTYNIWTGGKTDKAEFSEFKGKPKDLTCELTDDTHTVDLGIGFIGTNCHWTVD